MIDSHAHIGEFRDWAFSINDLYIEMQKNGIARAIISNISGNEFDYEHNKLNEMSSYEVNEVTLEMTKPYGNIFKILAWIRPFSETDTDSLERLIEDNRNQVVGLKVHPFTAKVPMNDTRYDKYLALCQKYHLPFCILTEEVGYSNVHFVASLAQKYPNVQFVMVHMGLRTDHKEALSYLLKYPNLYGDTTIVDTDTVMEVLSSPLKTRILFGSDAPTLGADSYSQYASMHKLIKEKFDNNTIANLYQNNCVRLFGLEDSWTVD